MSILIEYSKSNKALCKSKLCVHTSKVIQKDDLRFRFAGLGFIHWECLTHEQALLIGTIKKISGWEKLEAKDIRMLETLIVRLIEEAEHKEDSLAQEQLVDVEQGTSYFSAVMLLHKLVHEGLIAEKIGKETEEQLRSNLINDLLDVIELLRGRSSTVESGKRSQITASTPMLAATVTPEGDQLASSLQPSPDIATSMLGANHTAATTPALPTRQVETTIERRQLEPITEAGVPMVHTDSATGNRKGQLPALSTTAPGRRKSVRLNPEAVEIQMKQKATAECALPAGEFLTAALNRVDEKEHIRNRSGIGGKHVPEISASVVGEPTSRYATTSTAATTTSTPIIVKSPYNRTRKDSESIVSSPSPWRSTEQERMDYLDYSLELYERRRFAEHQPDSDAATSNSHVASVFEGDYYDSDVAWIGEQNYGTADTGGSATDRVSTDQLVAEGPHTSPTMTTIATAPTNRLLSLAPSSAPAALIRSQAQRRLRELLHLDPLPLASSSHSTATPTRQRPQRHSIGHK